MAAFLARHDERTSTVGMSHIKRLAQAFDNAGKQRKQIYICTMAADTEFEVEVAAPPMGPFYPAHLVNSETKGLFENTQRVELLHAYGTPPAFTVSKRCLSMHKAECQMVIAASINQQPKAFAYMLWRCVWWKM